MEDIKRDREAVNRRQLRVNGRSGSQRGEVQWSLQIDVMIWADSRFMEDGKFDLSDHSPRC
jgi:hypothetical protein